MAFRGNRQHLRRGRRSDRRLRPLPSEAGRGRIAGAANCLEHIEAGPIRQHTIENDSVEGVVCKRFCCVGDSCDTIHGKADQFQAFAQPV